MIDVIVYRKSMIADNVCAFELVRPDHSPLPAFSAGSHIDVHLPNGIIRQYSLCNAPDHLHRYEIAVLREGQSRGGSVAMHELQESDALQVGEPRNLFPLTPDAKRSFLFAGGIGITPILCMAERLAHINGTFQLHYCAKSENRAAFSDRISASIWSDHASFYFNEPEGSARLAAKTLKDYKHGDHLYVCGPAGFIDFILSQARNSGWPESSLHREFFASDSAEPHEDDGAFEVQLASDGRCFSIPADQSVADVLDDAGVEIPLSCEQGVCGTCVTRILDGEPDHRDMFLTDEEHARNDQFTPCCSRAKSARLVLDL